MQLKNAADVASQELTYIVQSIVAVKIYYVWTGRNAWWNTWSSRYSEGCMHLSLNSAKDYCEKRRTQGTVFYIDQLPSIAFIARDRILVFSEINTEKFLKTFQVNKFKELINIIPVSTMTLHQVAFSFNANSILWPNSYSKENSCILSFANFSDSPHGFEETHINEQLLSYTSRSSGPSNNLSWDKREFNKDASLLYEILAMLKIRMIDPNQSFNRRWLRHGI